MDWRVLFLKNNEWLFLDYYSLEFARSARVILLKYYNNVVIEYKGNNKREVSL